MSNNPKFENLKVVNVKSCTPGYADRADTGEKIAILRLMSCCTPHEPMLLSIFDVKKLIAALVDVLSFHHIDLPAKVRDAIIFSAPPADRPGRDTRRPAIHPSRRANMPTGPIQSDEVVKFLVGLSLAKTWPGPGEQVASSGSPVGDAPQPQYHRPATGGLMPLPFVLRRRESPRGKIIEYPVFGGYCNKDSEFVLYRFYADTNPCCKKYPMDSILRLGTPGTYRLGPLTSDEYLAVEEWGRFQKIVPGRTFRLGKNVWRKMTNDQLRRRLKQKILHLDRQ